MQHYLKVEVGRDIENGKFGIHDPKAGFILQSLWTWHAPPQKCDIKSHCHTISSWLTYKEGETECRIKLRNVHECKLSRISLIPWCSQVLHDRGNSACLSILQCAGARGRLRKERVTETVGVLCFVCGGILCHPLCWLQPFTAHTYVIIMKRDNTKLWWRKLKNKIKIPQYSTVKPDYLLPAGCHIVFFSSYKQLTLHYPPTGGFVGLVQCSAFW